MANTTVRGALAIHGQNPQFLVETVIRNRIYESSFWKEHCFALTAESLIDKALEMRYIGGVFGNQRPTEFLCLLLKLLQIQPEKEILVEYLQADEFKYLRALAAMYIRMTFAAADVYSLLEPLLKDFRKLRYRNMSNYTITHFDSFIDQLLTSERVCDIILPRLTKRDVLEELGEIGPRKSLLLDAMEGKERSVSRSRSRSRSRSKSRSRSRSSSRGRREEGEEGEVGLERRERGRSLSRSDRTGTQTPSEAGSRYVSRSRSGSRFRSRSRSISPDRMDTASAT